MPKFHNGELFPELAIDAVGGGRISSPATLPAHGRRPRLSRVLVPSAPMRSSPCSRGQQPSSRSSALRSSPCRLTTSRRPLCSSTSFTFEFPVGYGANADGTAKTLGAYLNADPNTCREPGSCWIPTAGFSLRFNS